MQLSSQGPVYSFLAGQGCVCTQVFRIMGSILLTGRVCGLFQGRRGSRFSLNASTWFQAAVTHFSGDSTLDFVVSRYNANYHTPHWVNTKFSDFKFRFNWFPL